MKINEKAMQIDEEAMQIDEKAMPRPAPELKIDAFQQDF